MTDAADDALLDEVVDAWEAGREPDAAALAARHRASPEEIERVIRAAARYRSSIEMLRPERTGSLRPGERLKDFEIVSFIGRGGMGEVYRARQLSLGGREVALKILPVLLQSEASRVRFRRECELLSNLHHPSLAEVYGFGEERGLSFFAMRLIDGVDLRAVHEHLRASGTTPPQAELRRTIVRWIAEVAEGLAVVHAADDRESHRPLVHRDVKPSNVIVERGGAEPDELPHGRAVLVDFGLVRPVELDTASRTEGSPATLDYASPEQLMGVEVDVSTDVFALGVTLHDLLTGRVPTERKRAALGLEPLEGVDRDLAAIVARACAPERRWRYANGAELRDDLRAWLDGRPVAARRRPLHERVRRGIAERPARVAKVVLAVIVALLGIVIAGKLGQYVQAAERVHRARDQRDLRAMLEPDVGIPGVLTGILLERETARLAKRCRSDAEDDALRVVLESLRRDDRSGALLAAATHLRVHGLAADRDVRWHFEGELRRALEEPGFDAELRAQAVRLLARLSFERPCETPEEVAANDSLRVSALLAWRNEGLPELDRLHGLSALSGFGTGEDLAPVLGWALETPRAPERARLALSVARWILMRMRGGAAGLAAVDFERATGAIEAYLRNVLAEREVDFRTSTRRDLSVYTLRHMVVDFAWAGRVAGAQTSRLTRLVPDDWVRALEQGDPGDPPLAWLLASCGDPRALERLLEGPWPKGNEVSDYWNWGAISVLTRDEAYLSDVRRRCAELASACASAKELMAAFDGGAESLRAWFAAGLPQEMKPDPDTLLGTEPGLPSGARPLASEPSGEALAESTLASWDFSSTPPSTAGAATGAWMRRAEFGSDERKRPYLRFAGFGSSEVELRFLIGGDGPFTSSSGPVLVLGQLAARRAVYPGHGMVFVEVIANGFTVSGRMVVTAHDSPDDLQEVGIPPYMLQPGENSLILRLHRDSMSTYRLYRAELRSGS